MRGASGAYCKCIPYAFLSKVPQSLTIQGLENCFFD